MCGRASKRIRQRGMQQCLCYDGSVCDSFVLIVHLAHQATNYGVSPAWAAAQNGHEEALRVLGELKADLNQVMDLPTTCQSIDHDRHV